MSSEPPADGTDALGRDPIVAIADYLNQFVADEPAADDRPDPRPRIRWLHREGWQITSTRSANCPVRHPRWAPRARTKGPSAGEEPRSGHPNKWKVCGRSITDRDD